MGTKADKKTATKTERESQAQISANAIFGMIVKLLCVTVCTLGFSFFAYLFNDVYLKESDVLRYTINMMGFLVAGAMLGILAAPHVQSGLEQTHLHVSVLLKRLPPQKVVSSSVGVAIGMGIAILASLPIYLFLPGHRTAGLVVCFAGGLLLSYLGASVFSRLPFWGGERTGGGRPLSSGGRTGDAALTKVIDSSVIIDGRLLPLVEEGFIEGVMQIPNLVLHELQGIADDDDPIRKRRGRNALETIEKLKEAAPGRVEIVDIERQKDSFESSVDALLLMHAKSIGGILVTNDYNLGKVAELRDVRIYNLNVLANTLRKTLLPGEVVEVNVVKFGKESGQGIAYLDDGTMIVIESGDKFIGETVQAEVSSIMQTVAGRLIFARIARDADGAK